MPELICSAINKDVKFLGEECVDELSWNEILTISDKIQTNAGGRSGGVGLAFINYKEKKFEIQLGKSINDYFVAPFPLSSYSGDAKSKLNLSLRLSYDEAFQTFKSLDTYVEEYVKKNKDKYFADDIHADLIKYIPATKESSNYDPTLKVKVCLQDTEKPIRECNFMHVEELEGYPEPKSTEIVGVENKMQSIQNNTKLVCTIIPSRIWIRGHEFGLTYETTFIGILDDKTVYESQAFVWG